MAQKGRGDFEGKLDRTFPRIFRYDAGPNIGTLRQKPKKTVKKKTRSGNIGRTSMKDFRSSGAIMGQTNIGKKMTPTYKPKIQNQKYTKLYLLKAHHTTQLLQVWVGQNLPKGKVEDLLVIKKNLI